MFTVWNISGNSNAYKPPPIQEPSMIRPVGDDENKEGKGKNLWEEALRHRKELEEEAPEDLKAGKTIVSYRKKGKITVSEVMKSPVSTLSPKDRWQDAWDLVMNKWVSHIPILSDAKKLVGIVSEKDLLRVKLQIKKALSKEENPPIDSFMQSNVISVSPNTSIRRAASVMFSEEINAMPVINESQSLVGIVTRTDILKVLVKRLPLKFWA